ncbi:sigma-54 dependent transcriptional regulator [uncultured Sphingomonas sp.]|uniref:sigma-54-dependent transcriptional regulator n=1 Tax=uncultured Sphingomonas sp. TaxID=158754 RepID=UPI00260BBDD7|nr:sigma-54 dependent transcriptional regulator [uncultured Sphingomonas sp.]
MTQAEATPLVALIDDEPDLRAAAEQLLTLSGFEVRSYADAASALPELTAGFAGVVVTDVRMPGMSGLDLFATLRARDPELPVLLLTGHGDIAMAVDAIKNGAWEFLSKPFDPDALVAAVTRASTARALTLENRRLRAIADEPQGAALIGDSLAIRRLRDMIPLLANAPLDLVIEGEVGTGREHLARLIHRAGKRSRHRFLVIDCATVPTALVERDLFARNGAIDRAHRGTLFLDHLEAAGPELQNRLIRFAEARALPIDGPEPHGVDVRIIAALEEGQRDRILPGLFHLLAGVPLRLPPLAERKEDIPMLFAHFAALAADRHGCALPPLADHAHRLSTRPWPGNVLELEKAAERICLGLDEGTSIADEPASLTERLDAFERATITDAVLTAEGEVAAAIKALQLPRKTFYYRVKRLGIDLAEIRRQGRGKA